MNNNQKTSLEETKPMPNRNVFANTALYIWYGIIYSIVFLVIGFLLFLLAGLLIELLRITPNWFTQAIAASCLVLPYGLCKKTLYYKVFENKGFWESLKEAIAFYYLHLKISILVLLNVPQKESKAPIEEAMEYDNDVDNLK